MGVTSYPPHGTAWLTGSGAPGVALGVNGDFYLDTDTGDVYEKSGGAWILVDNLTGPQGEPGLSAGKMFYLAPSDASDLTTYKTALESPSVGAEQTIATVCTGTDDVLVGVFATEPNVPGAVDLPAGTSTHRIYASVTGVAAAARLHVYIYKRNVAGTETLIRDDFSDDFTDTAATLQAWATTTATPGSLLATDRIVAKLYAQRVSGPASITVTTYYEGTSRASHVQSTISVGAQGPPGADAPAGLGGGGITSSKDQQGPKGDQGEPGEPGEGGGNGFGIPPIVPGDFSWVNQGDATVRDSNGESYITAPNSSTNVRARVKSKIPPFTLTVLIFMDQTLSLNSEMGILLRESATDKMVALCMRDRDTLSVQRYANVTTITTTVANKTLTVKPSMWLRIQHDGTNIISSYSLGGANFIELDSHPKTASFTTDANQIAYFVCNRSSGGTQAMSVASWLES